MWCLCAWTNGRIPKPVVGRRNGPPLFISALGFPCRTFEGLGGGVQVAAAGTKKEVVAGLLQCCRGMRRTRTSEEKRSTSGIRVLSERRGVRDDDNR